MWNLPTIGVGVPRGARWATSRSLPLSLDAVQVATMSVVALGIALRARGFLFDAHGLWLDEAAWALSLMKRDLVDLLIRPPGFMAVSRLLATVLGPSEMVLRSVSWVAGIGSVLLAVPLSRRLYVAKAARLLFVAIIALHPAAIDLSKEFKPYSLSLFLHLLLLFLTLRYTSTRSPRDLLYTLLVANVSILFAQDLVFALPGVFLVLGADAWLHDRSRLPWLLAFGIGILGTLGAQYLLIWRHIASNEHDYWGRKYGVFYTRGAGESYVGWWLDRYAGLAELPDLRRRLWQASWLSSKTLDRLDAFDRFVWLFLHLAGLARLAVDRRLRLLVLTMLPIFVHWAFNALGFWPAGVFRTNLFLLGYTAVIASAAVEWLPNFRRPLLALVPTSLLIVLPLVLFERTWNAHKHTFANDTDFPAVVAKLVTLESAHSRHRRVKLLVQRESCRLYEYYTTLQPELSETLGRAAAARFDMSCVYPSELMASITESLPETGHMWLLAGLSNEGRLRHQLPGARLHDRGDVQGYRIVELTRKRADD